MKVVEEEKKKERAMDLQRLRCVFVCVEIIFAFVLEFDSGVACRGNPKV